tara:strand:- start:369 stop:566 length:198 start_codon:yes stop_codon:yes gene_type:complete
MLLLLCYQGVAVLLVKNQLLVLVAVAVAALMETLVILDKVAEEHKLLVVLEDLVMLVLVVLDLNC